MEVEIGTSETLVLWLFRGREGPPGGTWGAPSPQLGRVWASPTGSVSRDSRGPPRLGIPRPQQTDPQGRAPGGCGPAGEAHWRVSSQPWDTFEELPHFAPERRLETQMGRARRAKGRLRRATPTRVLGPAGQARAVGAQVSPGSRPRGPRCARWCWRKSGGSVLPHAHPRLTGDNYTPVFTSPF